MLGDLIMRNKKNIIIISSIILIVVLVFTLVYSRLSDSSESSESNNKPVQTNEVSASNNQLPANPDQSLIDPSQENDISSESQKTNDYYVLYINNTDGSTASFVPPSLNPNFKEGESYNVSISIDDDGNIINNDKIIVVNDYILSDENKDYIHQILPDEKQSSSAIEEIQKQIDEVKENSK